MQLVGRALVSALGCRYIVRHSDSVVGKSTITLALLRAITTTGKVYYDGILIDSINLDALRSNVTLIPQSPELLHGTLRENLDPFNQQDDATLNDALRAAGLFDSQEPSKDQDAGEHTKITLETMVESGGTNFSVGQQQIIALSRAIVRRSKLLILDEATAAIGESNGYSMLHVIYAWH